MRIETGVMPEIIDCVATGRNPTVDELSDVAKQIWSETAPDRSALSWSHTPPTSGERAVAMRLALAAMCGRESVA